MPDRPGARAPRVAIALAALAALSLFHDSAAADDEAKFQRDLARLKNCAILDSLRAKEGTRPLTPYEKRLKAELVPWYIAHCLPGAS
jgi:hypothetical protein